MTYRITVLAANSTNKRTLPKSQPDSTQMTHPIDLLVLMGIKPQSLSHLRWS